MKLLAIISLLFISQFSNAYTREDKCIAFSEYTKIVAMSRYAANDYAMQYDATVKSERTSNQFKVVTLQILDDMYAKDYFGSYSELKSVYDPVAKNYANQWFRTCLNRDSFNAKLKGINWDRFIDKLNQHVIVATH